MIPNVPTVNEAGVPGYEVTSWNGVFAPKGTSKEALDTMNVAMREVLATAEIKDQFGKLGVVARASSPEEQVHVATLGTLSSANVGPAPVILLIGPEIAGSTIKPVAL